MTREEAIMQIESLKNYCEYMADSDESGAHVFDLDEQALDLALSALRPVSREKVERMRGEWTFKPFYKGTSRGAIECQECKSAFEGSVEFNFCPYCGAPMTDEAVDMMLERWKEAVDGETD